MDKIAGYLGVGLNEQNEIVINHPDLKPDENGVGHIVFSIRQARHLAQCLLRHAFEAERTRQCLACGQQFLARTHTQACCSTACRKKYASRSSSFKQARLTYMRNYRRRKANP
jgi:hypothetical protein